MVSFQTQNPNFSKFWRATDWQMLIYVMATWNILQTFGIFYNPLVHFVFIWDIFSSFGVMHQEKSGNPGCGASCSQKTGNRFTDPPPPQKKSFKMTPHILVVSNTFQNHRKKSRAFIILMGEFQYLDATVLNWSQCCELVIFQSDEKFAAIFFISPEIGWPYLN
jgi:hypothetical protein